MAGERETITLSDDKTEIINNFENAPLIHIDGAQGLLSAHGNIKINLFQLVQEFGKAGPSGSVKKLVVARLSMSRQVAQSFAVWLAEHVMEKPNDSTQVSPSKSPDGK